MDFVTLADLIWFSGDSPTQMMGAAPRSDQSRWENHGRADPSGTGNGFQTQFAHDFDLMAEIGLRAIRLTIDWARVEPVAGRIDDEELERLDAMYAAAKERHLAVWTTLHQSSMPGWFAQDTDGFATDRGPSLHWSRHVEAMAERFDPHTHLWAPVDDPVGWAVSAYHLGTHPPGRRVTPTEGGKLVDAIVGSLDATFEAHRILQSGDKPVAGIFRPPIVRSGIDEDGRSYEQERQWWDDVFWNSWSHAIREGELLVPGRTRVERPDIADAFDLLMIGTGNLGGADIVEAGEDGVLTPKPQSASGILHQTLHRVAEAAPGYDLAVLGVGAKNGDESQQLSSIETALESLMASVADGLPITAVMLEPFMDGYDISTGQWSDAGLFTANRQPKAGYSLIEAQR